MSSDAFRKALDQVRLGFASIRAAFDPTMMQQLEEASARMAPLEAMVRDAELESRKEQRDLARALEQEKAKLERLVRGTQKVEWENLKALAGVGVVTRADVLRAMELGVSPAELRRAEREQELVAAAHAQQGRVTVNNFTVTAGQGGVGFGGGGSGGGGGGMSSSGTTVGFSGGGATARPRISQAEFVRIASQGDLANHVWLQGDGGAGDLLVLSAYQVKPEENTGNLVLVHAEAATPGATLKDTRQRLPPAGGLWWVQGVSLGPELADGARPVVIRASPRDAIAFGPSQERAPKAVDRLRFIPEEDVLEMAGKFLVRGSLNGVPWVLNDSVPNELPLLYAANEALGGVPGTPAEKTLPWAELYARLLLGEEE